MRKPEYTVEPPIKDTLNKGHFQMHQPTCIYIHVQYIGNTVYIVYTNVHLALKEDNLSIMLDPNERGSTVICE